jgi:hypothetical protein
VTSPDKWAETAKDAAAWVQDNPRTLGNVTGEIAETALEVALTAGAATAAKKVTTEAAERAVREATERAAREAAEKAAKEAAERAAREVAEDGVQKSLPKVITKEKPLYKDLGKVEPCFLHGTLISTISGLKPIELIDQKDTVIVFDFETRTFATKNVVQKFKNWAMTYFIIDTDSGDSIKATGKHLFWLENERKWKIAKKLGCGDVLKTPSGLISVTDVVRIDNVEVDTFNLEVQDCHNYLVGMNGILVHNKSKPSKFESKTTKEIKIYEVYDPGPPEKVKYVGQTDKPSVGDRFKEHKTEGRKKGNHKKNWEKYRVREVKRGHWTPYEASVWEQHYIEKNGGKTNLQNVRNEITQKKYDRYAGQHNPCK